MYVARPKFPILVLEELGDNIPESLARCLQHQLLTADLHTIMSQKIIFSIWCLDHSNGVVKWCLGNAIKMNTLNKMVTSRLSDCTITRVDETTR